MGNRIRGVLTYWVTSAGNQNLALTRRSTGLIAVNCRFQVDSFHEISCREPRSPKPRS